MLVGYDQNYWIIKNSWGTGWGQGGFAYVSKSSNCGINNLVNFLIVDGPRYTETVDPVDPDPVEPVEPVEPVDPVDPDPVDPVIPEGFAMLQVFMLDTYGDGWDTIFSLNTLDGTQVG